MLSYLQWEHDEILKLNIYKFVTVRTSGKQKFDTVSRLLKDFREENDLKLLIFIRN